MSSEQSETAYFDEILNVIFMNNMPMWGQTKTGSASRVSFSCLYFAMNILIRIASAQTVRNHHFCQRLIAALHKQEKCLPWSVLQMHGVKRSSQSYIILPVRQVIVKLNFCSTLCVCFWIVFFCLVPNLILCYFLSRVWTCFFMK